MNSRPVTPAYLAWKKAGSPGVWCLSCDCPADADHVHAQPKNPDVYNPVVTEGGTGPTPPGEYRKVGEYYVYGMTPQELDHHNRRSTPVTGSAFKDDPDPKIKREPEPEPDEPDEPEDHVEALMRCLGLPKNRETYINLNFLGDYGPEDELPAELEAGLPSKFQRIALDDENLISDKEQ